MPTAIPFVPPQYYPFLSQEANAEIHASLLKTHNHMCRCSECEKCVGLLYQECCHRILCDWCHRTSKCDGHNTDYSRPQPQGKPKAVVPEQSSLWTVVS